MQAGHAVSGSAPQALVLADSRKARVRHLLVHREAGVRVAMRSGPTIA